MPEGREYFKTTEDKMITEYLNVKETMRCRAKEKREMRPDDAS